MTNKQRDTGGIQDIWKVTQSRAESVQSKRKIRLELKTGETPLLVLQRKLGDDCLLTPMKTQPNEYHARMVRPIHYSPWSESHVNEGSIIDVAAKSLGSLASLVERLQSICRVVHPKANSSVYGHEIRNLLILACTDVEANCRGILEANGHSKAVMNTHDFIKLRDPMQLEEYSVSLPYFPWLPSFQPFLGWDSLHPTKSLKWYAAYNAVKHDREKEFHQATLINAIEAVCACFIIIRAQFGTWTSERGAGHDVQKFFLLVKRPHWNFDEYYFSTTPGDFGARWKPKNYF